MTLLHGDIPQRLQDLGGWTNPLVGAYFLEYAKIAFDNFGDRVSNDWLIRLEPGAANINLRICRFFAFFLNFWLQF